MGSTSAHVEPERLLAETGRLRELARRLVQPNDVDDVVQETWRIALESPPRLAVPAANLSGWLATVMRNLVRRARRRDSGHVDQAASTADIAVELDSDPDDRVLLHRRLVDAVLALHEPYKSAIVLRYFDGLDLRQLANAQRVSYDAARQRVSRALGMLRARLDSEHRSDRSAWSALFLAQAAAMRAHSIGIAGGIAVGSKTMSAIGVALALICAAVLWCLQEDPHSLDAGSDSSPAPRQRELVAVTDSTSGTDSNLEREIVAPSGSPIDRDRDLHGTVLDPAGAPVAAASITVLHDDFSEFSLLDYVREREPSVVALLESNSRGEFAVPLPYGREFRLTVEAPGFARASFEHCHAGERVEVHLEFGAVLVGRVSRRGDDAPMINATLELSDDFSSRANGPVYARTTTDADGVFRFEGLTSGTRRLEVTPTSADVEFVTLTIEAGVENQRDIAVDGGKVVTGRVIDADTLAPIEGAEVAPYGFRRAVRTNAKGEFVYGGFRSSPGIAVCVRATGYARTELPLDERWNDARVDDLEIRLQRGRNAHGRVVDSNGVPIVGVYVAAASSKAGPRVIQSDWVSAHSGEDGRFEIEHLRSDMPHVLWLVKSGFARLAYTFPEFELDAPTIDFGDIHLAKAASIGGVVVDEAGVPFAHQTLHLRGWNFDLDAFGGLDPSASTKPKRADTLAVRAQGQVLEGFLGLRESRTDDLGRFGFTDLAAGSYELRTRLRGAAEEDVLSVQIAAGQSPDRVRFVVPRGLSIHGRVVDPRGEPVVAFVGSMSRTGGRQVSRMTDVDGRFVLEGLEATEYRVTATPQGRDESGRPRWLPIEERGVAAGSRDLILVVPLGVEIFGAVLASDGLPASNVRVQAIGAEDGRSHWRELDENGGFSFWLGDEQVYDLYARPLSSDGQAGDRPQVDFDDRRAGVATGVRPGSPSVSIRMP